MSSNPIGSGPRLPGVSPSMTATALVGTIVLIVIAVLIHYSIRRLGGRRRAWRWLRRELALAGRAFIEPVRAFQRHQREVRVLVEHLGDPRAHLFVRRALSAVQLAVSTAPGAYCYAVRVGPYGGEVQLASRRPVTAPQPWQADEDNPLSWYIDPEQWDALPTAHGPTRRRPLPVTVGITSEEEDCVVLDLAAGPRMIRVEGDHASALRLLYCLAAQLDAPSGGARVLMAGGVHPELPGPRLDSLLDELEGEAKAAEPEAAGEVVVVCSSPTEEQERRLRALARTSRIVCLAHGRLAGHCWALRVDARGRVLAAELGLEAGSSSLPKAVAESIREGARLTVSEARPPARRTVPAAGNGRTGGRGGGPSRRHARTAPRRAVPRHASTAPASARRQSAGQDTTAPLPTVAPPGEPRPNSLAEPDPSERPVNGTSSAPR